MPRTIFFLLLISSLLNMSCDNEPLDGGFDLNNDDVFDPNANATFQVNLNGSLFVAEDISAIQEEALSLIGQNGNVELSINITNPEVGNYSIANNEEISITYVPNRNSAQQFYTATSGELIISNYNQEIGVISGSFSGNLTEFVGLGEDIQMTNGIFQDITFVEVVELPGDDELPGDGDTNGDDEDGEN